MRLTLTAPLSRACYCTRYVGEFKAGMFHGKGTVHNKNGSYSATWEFGKVCVVPLLVLCVCCLPSCTGHPIPDALTCPSPSHAAATTTSTAGSRRDV